MTLLLQISGPGSGHSVSLPASGAELTLGRDASADVVLADPDKWISRKHVGACALADGIRLRVLSAVNGIETSAGPLGPGQSGTLLPGGHFVVGPFRVDVLAAPESAPAIEASDPFAALFGAGGGPVPLGQDPFNQAGFMPPSKLSPSMDGGDPFSAFSTTSSGRPGALPVAPLADFFGGGAAEDPLSALSGARGGIGHQGLNTLPNVSDWLGGGLSAMQPAADMRGPLDLLLGKSPATPGRTLSPEHVHSIHMPLAFGSIAPKVTPLQRQQAPTAPPLVAPANLGAPSHDAWDMLLAGNATPLEAISAPAPVPLEAETWRPEPQCPTDQPDGDPFMDIGADHDDAFSPWATTSFAGMVDLNIEMTDPASARISTDLQSGSFGGKTVPQPRSQLDLPAGDVWAAFARGLGLPADHAADVKAAESAGAMVRLLIEGMSELLAARAELKRELRAEDRTMLSGRDNNPMKLKLSAHELVQYLFATQVMGGYMPAERAVRESVSELCVHEVATITAARAAVEGALRDFEPERLKKKLLRGKSGFFKVLDNASIWEAYEQHYDKQSQQMADWMESMFSRHFMPAYSRETERLKSLGEKKPTA